MQTEANDKYLRPSHPSRPETTGAHWIVLDVRRQTERGPIERWAWRVVDCLISMLAVCVSSNLLLTIVTHGAWRLW